MEEELDRLKQLNQQFTHHINHETTVQLDSSTVEADKDPSVAKSAFDKTPLETVLDEKALAGAIMHSVPLVESKSKWGLRQMEGKLDRLKQLNQQLTTTGHKKHETTVQCDPSTVEAGKDLSGGD